MSQVKISRLTLTFTSQNPHRIHLHITSKSEHATYTHNITNIENTSLSLTSLTYKVALRCSAQTGRPQVIGNYFAILIPVRLNPSHSMCVCVCSPHTLLIHPPFQNAISRAQSLPITYKMPNSTAVSLSLAHRTYIQYHARTANTEQLNQLSNLLILARSERTRSYCVYLCAMLQYICCVVCLTVRFKSVSLSLCHY